MASPEQGRSTMAIVRLDAYRRSSMHLHHVCSWRWDGPVGHMFTEIDFRHLTDKKWVISGLAFVGKFGIAASFAIIYIFAGELYPTVLRAVGMGMSSMVAGIGLLVAPYLVYLVSLMPERAFLMPNTILSGSIFSNSPFVDHGRPHGLRRHLLYVPPGNTRIATSSNDVGFGKIRETREILVLQNRLTATAISSSVERERSPSFQSDTIS